MKILGIHTSINSNGVNVYTLHVADEFNAYYKNLDTGRDYRGQKVETIFVGDYDCSNLEVGTEIEVFYEKAITTNRGTFQPIKKIEIIE